MGFGLRSGGFGDVILGFRVGQIGFAEWCGGCLGSGDCVRAWRVSCGGWGDCLGLGVACAGLCGPVLGLGVKGFGLRRGSERHRTTANGTTTREETARHGTTANGTAQEETERPDKLHGTIRHTANGTE